MAEVYRLRDLYLKRDRPAASLGLAEAKIFGLVYGSLGVEFSKIFVGVSPSLGDEIRSDVR